MNRGGRGGIVCALSSVLVVVACSSGDQGPKSVSTADAYVAAIRWYVDTAPAPAPTDTTDTNSTVLYIVPADGSLIDANAQVEVLAELADMSDTVTVLFADGRDEAIDLEVDGQPVKDDGSLLLVGKVAEGPPPIEVSIEVYRSIDDDESFQMRIVRAGSDDYTVTAVTQLEQS